MDAVTRLPAPDLLSEFDELTSDAARRGLGSIPASRLVDVARRAQLLLGFDVLIDVVADRSAPEIVRLRALGRLHRRLATRTADRGPFQGVPAQAA